MKENLLKRLLLKYLFFITFVIVILFIMFINLGKFFDVSEAPQQSDVIVCLGGGSGERISKTLELYLSGYSKSEKIILTGSTEVDDGQKKYDKITYLVKNGVLIKNIIFITKTSNTMKEVVGLKNYLLQNHLKSVMFISDPHHSRRIMFLANTIANYKSYGLSSLVAGSDVKWWNREHYYRNKKAVLSVTLEVLKLPTNYIAYGILEPLGLYDPIKEYIGSLLYSIKYHIQKILH